MSVPVKDVFVRNTVGQTKLTDAVKSVGAEGGFTFIMPNEQALLLYKGNDVVDVTPQVRAKLGLK